MARIIEFGKDREYEIECKNCNSIIGYKKQETKIIDVSDEGCTYKAVVVTCPCCSHQIEIYSTPPAFSDAIKKAGKLFMSMKSKRH